jgi:hypothetical protein
MKPAAQRRRELERHIASSRSVQRGSIWVGAIGVLLGLAVGSLVVALIAASIAIAGAWITWGHIDDFRKELRGLR